MNAMAQDKLQEIITHIKENTYQKEDAWERYSYRQMAYVFKVPYNDVKLFTSQLRSNPNIDYRYVPTEARYRPIKYRYVDLSDNAIALEKFQQLSRKEFEYAVSHLNETVKEEDVAAKHSRIMMLLIIAEEMKREGFLEDWHTAKTGSVCRYTGLTEREVEACVDQLKEASMLRSLGASSNYMLALSEEAWQNLEDAAYSKQFENVLQTSQKISENPEDETFHVLTELNEIDKNIDEFIAFNSHVGMLLLRQKKLLTALQEKETVYANTLVRIDAVSKNYVATQEENKRLQEENKQLRNEIRLSDKFYKERQTRTEEKLNAMSASLVSVLESYFSRPVREKNLPTVTNKTKADLLHTVFTAIEDIKSGKDS